MFQGSFPVIGAAGLAGGIRRLPARDWFSPGPRARRPGGIVIVREPLAALVAMFEMAFELLLLGGAERADHVSLDELVRGTAIHALAPDISA